MRSSPCRVVVGLGRASVGRVGVGSDRVGSGRVRVELWLGWVGPLSDQGVVSQFGVESGWVDPTRLDPKPTDHTLIRQRPDPTQPQLETEMTRPNPSQNRNTTFGGGLGGVWGWFGECLGSVWKWFGRCLAVVWGL